MPRDKKNRIAISKLRLRPMVATDMSFLKELYGTTRDDILQSTISGKLQQLLIDLQFMAQHKHYAEQFADASFQIIEFAGQPVGRFYVNESAEEVRVIDIAVMPEYRNQGIGRHLLKSLLDRFRGSGRSGTPKPIRLRVNPLNPARKLYQSLGFQLMRVERTNWHMQYQTQPSRKSVFTPNAYLTEHSKNTTPIPLN